MPIPKGPDCFGDVMGEFKRGQLHSGKKGPVVKSKKQAKAIASSMCHSERLQEMGFDEESAKAIEEAMHGEFAPLGYPTPFGGGGKEGLKKGQKPMIVNNKERPDYPDVDKDGDRKESMEAAVKNAKAKRAKAKSKGIEVRDVEHGEEENYSLWANVHAKRKRGEKPNKPGDEGYPDTLDVAERKSKKKGDCCDHEEWDEYEEYKVIEELDYKDDNKGVGKSLAAKAKKHNIPVGILRTIYRRGVGAAKTSGTRPGHNPTSWGHARVNAFIRRSPGTKKADADMMRKRDGKKPKPQDKKNDPKKKADT